MQAEALYNILLNIRLHFSHQTVRDFVNVLRAMGGRSIGRGAWKEAYEVEGVVVKFGIDTWDHDQVTAALREVTCPDGAKHLFPETYGDQGIIVQEKAAVLGSTLRDSSYEMWNALKDEVLHTLYENGGRAYDLHDGNWGIRHDGSPVIFDGAIKWDQELSPFFNCSCGPCYTKQNEARNAMLFDEQRDRHYNPKRNCSVGCQFCVGEQEDAKALDLLMGNVPECSCGCGGRFED